MKTLTKTLILSMLLLATACGADSNGSGDAQGNNGANNGGTRTGNQALEGRMDSEDDANLEGNAVVVSEVRADGTTEVISDGEAHTDSNGHYAVSVEHSGGDLIVELVGSESIGSALVSSRQIALDTTTTVAPISAETTVETMLFLEAHADGTWNDNCTIESLRGLVSGEFAIDVLSSGSEMQGSIDAYADAAVGAMTAEGQTLEGEFVGMTSAEMDALFDARAQAQAEFDASLHAAADAEAAAEAAEQHAEDSRDAAIQAGLSAEEAGLAAEAAAWTSFTYVAELEGEARAQAMSDTNMTLASHTTAEVEAHFMAFGGEIDAIVEAGAQLEAELATAGQDADDAGDEIDAAWAHYEAIVEAELEARLEESLGLASVLVATEVQAAILASSQALSAALLALEAGADAATSASAAVDAFGDFQGQLQGDAFVSSLTAAGMSDGEAQATVELFALLSLR